MTLANLNLTGHFLIAMPNMQDPYFAQSVTFICAHNQDGAMGIIINRPTEMDIETLFEKINIPLNNKKIARQSILYGGPVQPERGFVLHTNKIQSATQTPAWNSALSVTDDITLTTSKDILEALAEDAGPEKLLFSLGYAGWTPGQLEQEILQNAWLSAQAKEANLLEHILYDIPYAQKRNATIQLLGIDPAMLSDVAGHA